ncbi:MAG: hypothetical protein J5732_05455 [Bacteroidaceae bacterium]|nr:hypothetical protein [Bacteroidaceae bacterium]
MYIQFDRLVNGHILNPVWHSRKERHDRREEVQANSLERYLSKWYLGSGPAIRHDSPVSDSQEKIYSIWLQGEEQAPPLVRACFASIRRHCTQPLEVLDALSLKEKIKLPDVIVRKYESGKMLPAHYADICRVELLHRYGGYWLDSTCFVTAPVPKCFVEQDFFMYMTGTKYGSPYSFVQNCFIRARKGSYLLEAWRNMIIEYWRREESHTDYFQHQLMFKTLVRHDPKASGLFEKMLHIDQDPTHVLWETIRDRRYDESEFNSTTSGAFFQKLSLRGIPVPVTGSTLYEMIYNMNS